MVRTCCIAAIALALFGAGLPMAEAGLKRVPTDGSSKIISPAQLQKKKAKTKRSSALQDKRASVSTRDAASSTAGQQPLSSPLVYDVSASAPTQMEISNLKKEKKEKKKAEKKARKEKAKQERAVR